MVTGAVDAIVQYFTAKHLIFHMTRNYTVINVRFVGTFKIRIVNILTKTKLHTIKLLKQKKSNKSRL